VAVAAMFWMRSGFNIGTAPLLVGVDAALFGRSLDEV
jgi:hypothetical protein